MSKISELHVQMQDEMFNSILEWENGNITILDTIIFLEQQRKDLETSLTIIKSFKDEKFSDIENEAADHKDGYNGYTFEIRNGGRMFNYKGIEEWKAYNKALKECEGRSKQAFLSMEKGLMTASEDGEEIELPEVSYRKSSLIIKEKKC